MNPFFLRKQNLINIVSHSEPVLYRDNTGMPYYYKEKYGSLIKALTVASQGSVSQRPNSIGRKLKKVRKLHSREQRKTSVSGNWLL